MARTVAALLTQSRLDFADSVLIGTSSSNVCKLQLVQNCLAIECYFKTIPIQLPASYCNFTGLTLYLLELLTSPKLPCYRVLLQDYSNSVTSLLLQLYWLPVIKRIKFKIATLAYHSVAFGQPTYLPSVLVPHQPQRFLHSVNQNLLSVARCKSSFGQRSFPTVPLKSGMTYHFRSDSPLHSIALGTT